MPAGQKGQKSQKGHVIYKLLGFITRYVRQKVWIELQAHHTFCLFVPMVLGPAAYASLTDEIPGQAVQVRLTERRRPKGSLCQRSLSSIILGNRS